MAQGCAGAVISLRETPVKGVRIVRFPLVGHLEYCEKPPWKPPQGDNMEFDPPCDVPPCLVIPPTCLVPAWTIRSVMQPLRFPPP